MEKSDKLERNSLKKEKELIDSNLFKITVSIVSLEKMIEALALEGTLLQEKSNNVISQLNDLRRKSKSIYEEWEQIKENINWFQNFEGKVKNLICKNIQFKEFEKCSEQSLKNF
ncbi:hypothetical protein MSUIS_06010 [Mycoplasma suis KI3806]|uniref:Uncharacterized protein n=1 Tax=Mycoplasma suis (strain KI_3806) TaxID=708248 RepID=F0V213_MYCS3|nr:hypothetical protein [Mycoplasma suis]CBZ40694.1 hypothetical protein MSUIS_06010 [Mycoplasma suis KI3806]